MRALRKLKFYINRKTVKYINKEPTPSSNPNIKINPSKYGIGDERNDEIPYSPIIWLKISK